MHQYWSKKTLHFFLSIWINSFLINACYSREFSTRSLDLSSTSSLSSGSRWALPDQKTDEVDDYKQTYTLQKMKTSLARLHPSLVWCHGKIIFNQGRFTVKKGHTTEEKGNRGRIRLSFHHLLLLSIAGNCHCVQSINKITFICAWRGGDSLESLCE